MPDDRRARSAVAAAAALAGLVCTGVAGCLPIDQKTPKAELVNYWSESVTLTLSGVDSEPEEFVGREGGMIHDQDGELLVGEDCVGDGFVVAETATGRVLGSSDEPVCGDTVIIVTEDGTLQDDP